jgi:hypothetical protein
MQENEADRERRLRELASKLLFRFERRGSRFSLYRDVDVGNRWLMSALPAKADVALVRILLCRLSVGVHTAKGQGEKTSQRDHSRRTLHRSPRQHCVFA